MNMTQVVTKQAALKDKMHTEVKGPVLYQFLTFIFHEKTLVENLAGFFVQKTL